MGGRPGSRNKLLPDRALNGGSSVIPRKTLPPKKFETPADLSSRAAKIRIRRQGESILKSGRRGRMLARFLPLIGAGLLVALFLDLKNARQRQEASVHILPDLAASLLTASTSAPVLHPMGAFSLPMPANWQVMPMKGFTVYFKGPEQLDLGVLTVDVQDDSFPALLEKIDRVDSETGVPVRHEIIDFGGRKAVRRHADLVGLRLLLIDFAENGRSHHLQFSAHPSIFDQVAPAAEVWMKSYRGTSDRE